MQQVFREPMAIYMNNKYESNFGSANFLLMLQTEKIAGINVESLNELIIC